ncbi:MAG: DUF374 domain-containing protein [Alphaproteobacteria bacterium]|nr:DUF374 domain-containing protein [Alphaproteobacteria bacterium]
MAVTWKQRRKDFLRSGVGIKVFSALVIVYLWLVERTSKTVAVGRAPSFVTYRDQPPVIFAFWHRDIFATTIVGRRFFPHRGVTLHLLISQHDDARVLHRVSDWCRFGKVLGSSTRGGRGAMKDMRDVLLIQRHHVVVTPDGPRGPSGQVKPGAIALARMTGVPIVGMACRSSRRWTMTRTWDQFFVPKLFMTSYLALTPPLHFDRNEPLEEATHRLQLELDRLASGVDRVVRHAGRKSFRSRAADCLLARIRPARKRARSRLME